ncbi:uncharacterized protein LODBEIA_P10870 [Lodderomyces beijingensis]|uniref:Extracellular membrane protein CFEM domain-containing protein n=1 Tax=Lodderomyces beijingensis TaxID=1775926 RepID=A0ABP0ZFC6_9ASCO
MKYFALLSLVPLALANRHLYARAYICDSQECIDAGSILNSECSDSQENVLACVCQLENSQYWGKLSECIANCDNPVTYSPEELKRLYCDAPTPSLSGSGNASATGSVDPSSALAAILSTLSGLSSEASSSTANDSSSGSETDESSATSATTSATTAATSTGNGAATIASASLLSLILLALL